MIFGTQRDSGSAARGGESGLGDIFEAAVDSARYVSNLGAEGRATEAAYDAWGDEVERLTGIRVANPMRRRFEPARFGHFGPLQEEWNPEADFDRDRRKLAEQFPDFASIINRNITADAAARARGAEEKLADLMSRRTGWLRHAASFAGGFRGMLEDPVNVGTMFIGPMGAAGQGAKGLIWMALRQGLANAGVEAASQPIVQNWRKRAGLDYGLGHAAVDVGMAGLLGFGMDAGVRAAWRGGRAALGHVPVLDAQGRVTGYRRAEDALDETARAMSKSSLVRQAADGDTDALHRVAKAAGIADDPAYRGARAEAQLEDELTARGGDGPELAEMAARDPVRHREAELQAFRHAIDPDEPPPVPDAGIRVWHGSPHMFDRFEMSALGSGEGAQAFGHGLYFAETEAVARSYQEGLGDYSDVVKWNGPEPPTPLQQSLMRRLGGPDVSSGRAMTVDRLKREIGRMIRDAEHGMFPSAERAKQYRAEWAELNRIESMLEVVPAGHLYEARINARPEHFLDWDKPLSEQSAYVKQALKRAGISGKNSVSWRRRGDGSVGEFAVDAAGRIIGVVDETPSGKFFWRRNFDAPGEMIVNAGSIDEAKRGLMAAYKGHEYEIGVEQIARGKDAAAQLRAAGIQGVRYLDQGSRRTGEGGRNWVVFDDSLVSVVSRDGAPPTLSAEAREMVASGAVDGRQAALVASLVPDPQRHASVLRALADAGAETRAEAKAVIAAELERPGQVDVLEGRRGVADPAAEIQVRSEELQAGLAAPGPARVGADGVAEAAYIDQAMANLRATSRTAAGVVDTSASAGKAAQMAEGLTPETAARAAVDNFEAAIRDIYRRRDEFASMSPAGLADAADEIALTINRGILREGALYRADDSKKFPYTAVADLRLAREQFFAELSRRLRDPAADPVETAAFIEWRANLGDHFWADGVGKTSKALAAIPLMRAGMPLPKYRANKEFFSFSRSAPADPKKGPGDYLGPEYERFVAYYRTLFDGPDGTAAASPAIRTTEDLPGYGTPEYRAKRVFVADGKEIVGYESAVQHLRKVYEAHAGEGGLRAERKVTLLLGPPAAGKSSITGPLALHSGSAVLSADDAKFIMPEMATLGASGVHEESSTLAKMAQAEIMRGGGNLVLEKLGDNPAAIARLVGTLRSMDYEVDVVAVGGVPRAELVRRAAEREARTGRGVPTAVIDAALEGVPKTLARLREDASVARVVEIDTSGRTPHIKVGRETLDETLQKALEAPARQLPLVQGGGGAGPGRGDRGSGPGIPGQEGRGGQEGQGSVGQLAPPSIADKPIVDPAPELLVARAMAGHPASGELAAADRLGVLKDLVEACRA